MCEYDEDIVVYSADSIECWSLWNKVIASAQEVVRRVPFELWQPGYTEAIKLIRPGFVPYAVTEWRPQHYYHLGAYGQHDVYLGVDGGLYTLTENYYADQMLAAENFQIAEILRLEDALTGYFRLSDTNEALCVAIEQELARIAKPPRPASLGRGHKVGVIVEVPMPTDEWCQSAAVVGDSKFRDVLYVRQLPSGKYFIDDKARLVTRSPVHKVLAVVHLRSILQRTDLQQLLTTLKQTV